MKKFNDILWGIIGILIIFLIGYGIPMIKQYYKEKPINVEKLKPLKSGEQSYIKNNIVYTSVASFPISCITKITVNTESIAYVIIEYRYNNTNGGTIIMSYIEYSRLFGVKK